MADQAHHPPTPLTTITKNGATVTPTTTVPGQNATVTFTGVATDPPYTLSLGPAIAVPVQITITGPTGQVVVDTFGNPIQNSSFPTDGSTAPFRSRRTGPTRSRSTTSGTASAPPRCR